MYEVIITTDKLLHYYDLTVYLLQSFVVVRDTTSLLCVYYPVTMAENLRKLCMMSQTGVTMSLL